jgi:hypothetical protein
MMSYNETILAIEKILKLPGYERRDVHLLFKRLNVKETAFCNAIIHHGNSLPLNSDQWFELFTKVPNKLFQYERHLMNKLTADQRKKLNFEII